MNKVCTLVDESNESFVHKVIPSWLHRHNDAKSSLAFLQLILSVTKLSYERTAYSFSNSTSCVDSPPFRSSAQQPVVCSFVTHCIALPSERARLFSWKMLSAASNAGVTRLQLQLSCRTTDGRRSDGDGDRQQNAIVLFLLLRPIAVFNARSIRYHR